MFFLTYIVRYQGTKNHPKLSLVVTQTNISRVFYPIPGIFGFMATLIHSNNLLSQERSPKLHFHPHNNKTVTYKSLQTIASRLAWCWFSRFPSFPGSDDPFQKKRGSLIPLDFQPKGWILTSYSYEIVIPTPNPNMALKKKFKAWYVWWHNLEGHGSLIFHQPLRTTERKPPQNLSLWVHSFFRFPTSLNTPSWARLSFFPCCQPKIQHCGWWFRNPGITSWNMVNIPLLTGVLIHNPRWCRISEPSTVV